MKIFFDRLAYKCATCGADECKLWKTLVSDQTICTTCAGQSARLDVSEITADGKVQNRNGDMIDQIGNYHPAIPKENGGFHHYRFMPTDKLVAWKALPSA